MCLYYSFERHDCHLYNLHNAAVLISILFSNTAPSLVLNTYCMLHAACYRSFFASSILPHINTKSTDKNASSEGLSLGISECFLGTLADTLAVEMLKSLTQLELEQPGRSRVRQ